MEKGFFDRDEWTWQDKAGRRKYRVITRAKDHHGNPLKLWNRGSSGAKGDKGTRRIHEVGKLVWGIQSDYNEKVIVLEELMLKGGRTELRLGYRTVTADTNKKRKGVWWWGESALMVPPSDLRELFELAADRGML